MRLLSPAPITTGRRPLNARFHKLSSSFNDGGPARDDVGEGLTFTGRAFIRSMQIVGHRMPVPVEPIIRQSPPPPA